MRLLSRASRGRLPWLAALVWQLAAPTILVSASQPTFDPSFKYPRHQNMVFYEGETVNVTYRSDWSEVSLYLFCKGSNSQIFSCKCSMRSPGMGRRRGHGPLTGYDGVQWKRSKARSRTMVLSWC